MKRANLNHKFCFESYGVRVRIDSNSKEVLERAVATATSALLRHAQVIDCDSAEQVISFLVSKSGVCEVVQNGTSMVKGKPDRLFWKYFDSLARILVAEFAKKYVFIHAGVVKWREKAILIPANSFYGKTTLVAELIRCGAEYYSDEYAVLDEDGLVHPFARRLAIRSDTTPMTETRLSAEELNGQAGTGPATIGCVLFTKYEAESTPKYEFLTPGSGVVKVIGQTIAIKRNTEFAINVLKKAFTSAIIIQSPRPDAGLFARNFLEFVDNTAI